MGNDLVTMAGGREVAPRRTPEGAQALRLIASSAAWRISDAADAERALSPDLRAALPLARDEAAALTAPATRRDFKLNVSAALSLVAPAGMSQEDQTTWLAVAAETLRGMPTDLLAMGCKVARETADHPAKIVPTIMRTVKRLWDDRRADLAGVDRLAAIARGERRRLPWEDEPFDSAQRATPAQIAEVLAELGERAAAKADEAKAA